MPARKGKGPETKTSTARAQPAPPATESSEPTFPFARYTSVVGVHTSLLAFSALILPASSPSLNIFARWDFSSSEPKPHRDIMQALTENPARTVAWMCAGAIVLQGWWASWIKKWAGELQTAGKADSTEVTQKKLERKGRNTEDITAFAQTAAMTLAGSAVFYAMTILFGAPLLSHPMQTYAMSLLLSVLTVLPPAYIFGPPPLGSDSPSLVSRLTWIRLFAELSPRTSIERALVYPAIGAVTGAWLGAIPIGLDWERPWQAWPLTPTFGAVGGYIAGSLVALVVSATLELAQADVAHEAQKAGKSKRS
ncbi:PIG-F-domain-containing protein [Polyporus arcularius HHB13444]|uniref:PIG-F-domain-containing protein n=1 Tax=Polyporus arcularius HHB13444 TaxID=1314778 RepID=A0A5C3PKD2_9APHY|nr:PIG-F-domain-containing protein [Polyporus arcularius HHB13444]